MATVTLTPPTYAKHNQHLSLIRDPELERLSATTFAIATYYIPFNLRKSVKQEALRGLPKHYLIPPKQPSELLSFIAKLCTQMKEDNDTFFTDLPERVNLRYDNSKAVFIGLCRETFADKVINWGRVVSIFTLAGTFSVYFVKKNQLSLVQKVSLWVQEFIDQELSDWIIEQGGWDDLPNKLSDKEVSLNWSRTLVFGSVVAAAGYLILATGLGK